MPRKVGSNTDTTGDATMTEVEVGGAAEAAPTSTVVSNEEIGETKREVRRYRSVADNLKIIIQPKHYKMGPFDSVLTIPGKSVQFYNGQLESDDPEVWEAVESDPTYGIKITRVDQEIGPSEDQIAAEIERLEKLLQQKKRAR